MVLAAGLGTRMRPLTDTIPKPLVRVGNQTMLDRVLDTFADAGVTRAVINTHHLPDQIEEHIARRPAPPTVAISTEISERLETGGGVKRALPLLRKHGDVFFTTNADSFWVGDATALRRLHDTYDPTRMDLLLLLSRREQSIGLGGHPGDFTMDDEGLLRRRSEAPAPYNYTGTAIMRADLFEGTPDTAFSLNLLFDRALERKRLFGLLLEGLWLTVGTAEAIETAELALAKAGHW
ncbi:MAG: nucleotidyltransferase family protein [Pseudomonadota bacterium]